MEKPMRQIMAESNRIGVQFLLADLEVGITFLDVAKVTRVDATRRRNLRSARAAYETVLRLLPRVMPSEEEQKQLNERLAELKSRLSAAGSETDAEPAGV